MILYNKRGGEQLLSIWWIAVLAFTGVGIVFGVSLFANGEVNMRDMEADILGQRLFDCIVDKGQLVDGVFSDSFNVYSQCGFDEIVFRNEDLFLKAKITDSKEAVKEIRIGNSALDGDCSIVLSQKIKFYRGRYPECLIFNTNVVDSAGRVNKIEILSASNHHGGYRNDKK